MNLHYAGLAKPEWGLYTRNGNLLYAYVMQGQAGVICLENMAGKVEKVRLLSDNSEVKETHYWNLKEYDKNAFFFNPYVADCYPLPDERIRWWRFILKRTEPWQCLNYSFGIHSEKAHRKQCYANILCFCGLFLCIKGCIWYLLHVV